jgi:hypothetical protein
MKAFGFLALLLGALFGAPGCDHGGSTPGNTLPVTINTGTSTLGYANGLFTSVTVCVPGTTTCQTLDYILVDTGSEGLRILSSAGGGELSLTLPQENDAEGRPLAECSGFLDGFTWGSVRMADVTMGDEEARSVPIQVIGDPGFSDVPKSCSDTGSPEDTVQTLFANGILGVGPFPQDCGTLCSGPFMAGDMGNPGIYYSCPSSGCQATAVPVASQVQNPVSMLPTDNNGVVVELPSVSAGGALEVTGTLLFGIGTQANNDLGSATVLPIDPGSLTFTTQYRGQSYPFSFIDSGSNALYVLDSNALGIPVCASTKADPNASDFYCPPKAESLTATNLGINGATRAASFSVASLDALTSSDSAFDDLAGPSGTTLANEYFDWGLPFFFGRTVFTAIEGSSAPGGQTPYFAY